MYIQPAVQKIISYHNYIFWKYAQNESWLIVQYVEDVFILFKMK